MESEFTKTKFSDDFRSGFLKVGDALSRSTLIQALGSYVIFRVDIKKYFERSTEKTVFSKPILVTDDNEIAIAIESLSDVEQTEGLTDIIEDGEKVGIEYSHYYVIEKQKPDWRAAQALWEHELGKATQKAEVSLEAKVSLSELLS